MSGAFCVEAGKVPAQAHEDCGGSGGHGSAPGGRFNTTLRAGSLWWSSGGDTRDKRATPTGRPTHRMAGTVPRNGSHDRYPAWCAGYDGCWATSLLVHVLAALRECRDRGLHAQTGTPRGRPSRGTAGSNPRTGGHQPKDWQAFFFFLTRSGSTVCPTCSWLTCPKSYVEFYSGLGAWYSSAYLCTPGFFLFFSLVSASSFCVFGGGFPSRSRLTATREVVRLPQELFSITALGRHFNVGAPSVPFSTGVRRESSKAFGSRPESWFPPLVYLPLFPGIPD